MLGWQRTSGVRVELSMVSMHLGVPVSAGLCDQERRPWLFIIANRKRDLSAVESSVAVTLKLLTW